MTTRARVLLVGLEPDIVDYSKSPIPGLTAAKVRAAVEADCAKLEALGYSVKSLYVDDGNTAEAVLTATLAADGYDCIMIGAGLRIVREELHVTSTVRRLPPAIGRWLGGSPLTQNALISNMEYVLAPENPRT
jgi:hypothetical protein